MLEYISKQPSPKVGRPKVLTSKQVTHLQALFDDKKLRVSDL